MLELRAGGRYNSYIHSALRTPCSPGQDERERGEQGAAEHHRAPQRGAPVTDATNQGKYSAGENHGDERARTLHPLI